MFNSLIMCVASLSLFTLVQTPALKKSLLIAKACYILNLSRFITSSCRRVEGTRFEVSFGVLVSLFICRHC